MLTGECEWMLTKSHARTHRHAEVRSKMLVEARAWMLAEARTWTHRYAEVQVRILAEACAQNIV